jgi:hypothetical protein
MTRLAEVAARLAGQALGAVMGVLARLRRRRPLHPRGVLLAGTLAASGDRARSVLPAARTDVLVRLSVSVGLPRGWPDIWGLAVRWTDDAGAPQDVLFASTGQGPVTRYLLAPRRTLTGGWLTTLMPLRAPWGPVLLALRPLDAASGAGVVLEVLHASPFGPWRPFGTLELHGPREPDATRDGPDPGVRFDPTRNAPRHLGTYRWEDLLRTPAYAVAQRTARVERR